MPSNMQLRKPTLMKLRNEKDINWGMSWGVIGHYFNNL